MTSVLDCWMVQSNLCMSAQQRLRPFRQGHLPRSPKRRPIVRCRTRHGAEVRPQRGEGRLPPAVRRRTGALLGVGAEGGTPRHVAQEGAGEGWVPC